MVVVVVDFMVGLEFVVGGGLISSVARVGFGEVCGMNNRC